MLPDETMEDLQFAGLKLLQKQSGFRFGMDAVLLADFAPARRRVMDLCAGSGIIGLLYAGRHLHSQVTAVEILPELADMARRSVDINQIEGRMQVQCADIRAHRQLWTPGQWDLVLCNPPYLRAGDGRTSPDAARALARHEEQCTLADAANAAGHLLKHAGHYAMIIKADRSVDAMEAMRRCGLEPKRGRQVAHTVKSRPSLVLLEGIKGAKPGFIWEPLLICTDENGCDTAEINRIYHRGEEGI